MIVSGVFDRFPKLKICLGHMGEAVHFWAWRLDYMNKNAQSRGSAPKLKLTPSEYLKRNFVITTSGQESHLALDFSIKALGAENVLWAIDYPYQPTTPAVAFMDSAPISDADKHKIYHERTPSECFISSPPALLIRMQEQPPARGTSGGNAKACAA